MVVESWRASDGSAIGLQEHSLQQDRAVTGDGTVICRLHRPNKADHDERDPSFTDNKHSRGLRHDEIGGAML